MDTRDFSQNLFTSIAHSTVADLACMLIPEGGVGRLVEVVGSVHHRPNRRRSDLDQQGHQRYECNGRAPPSRR